jgi:hypothetical protein
LGRSLAELAIYLRCRYFTAIRPRNYLVFGDIEGKLDVLRVQCTKCSRRGVYYLRRLIEKHGRKHDEMERTAQRGLSQARRTQPD